MSEARQGPSSASHLDMPIFVVDAGGRLIYYKEPAEPLLGVRFDEDQGGGTVIALPPPRN